MSTYKFYLGQLTTKIHLPFYPMSIHLVAYLYDSVYSVRMEPNIFRFAVVYNFIQVLLLEFQVRFWIRLPGLNMLHACACAKAGTWFLMIWCIQWSLKEFKRPVFEKTCSFWKDIRCEVNVCFIHIGGIVRIVDNHWLYLLEYD